MLSGIDPTMTTSDDIDTSLLCVASSSVADENLQRREVPTQHHCDRFLVKERVYTQQYAGIYFSRLNMLRPRVIASAKERWDKPGAAPPHIPRVLDVKQGEVCYIVGTVYMDMPLKPNILDEVTQEHWVIAPPPRIKYASEEDEVVLEDESGRVKLTGDILNECMLVTGIVVGILGLENSTGEFQAIDVCYPQLAPQPALRGVPEEAGDPLIAVASGLNVGEDNFSLELEILIDFLNGELGSLQDQNRTAHIARLILAGNSVTKPKLIEEEKRPPRLKYGAEFSTFDNEPLQATDTLLSELCQNLEVDMLPGETDPANCSLPQQPIHFAIFPKASQYSTFHTVTNPYAADIAGVSFLGSSGQNVDDIFRFVMSDDRLAIAERTLTWAHLAPTAPDTLWCHPYKDTDPFVLKYRPHVYFVGNQPRYETTVAKDAKGQKTRIVLIPSFAETSTIVLINLRTLQCFPVTLSGASI